MLETWNPDASVKFGLGDSDRQLKAFWGVLGVGSGDKMGMTLEGDESGICVGMDDIVLIFQAGI